MSKRDFRTVERSITSLDKPVLFNGKTLKQWGKEQIEAYRNQDSGRRQRMGGKKSKRDTEPKDREIAEQIAKRRPTWRGSDKSLITEVGKQYLMTYSGARKAMRRAAERAKRALKATRSPTR